MKKVIIALSILALLLVVGAVFFISKNSDNLATTETAQKEETLKKEQEQTSTEQQKVVVPREDAIWISSSFFQKSDKIYIDLDRDGDLFSKQDKGGLTEMRKGKVSSDVIDRVFSIIGNRSVLNTKDTDKGEPLFSQSEWVRVAIFTNGSLRSSASAPIEDFPSDFQNLLQELKSLAKNQSIDGAVKAVLFAELVDSKRADSIKNDPRKFYEFLNLTSADTANVSVLEKAITTPGRQIPISSVSELQKLEAYIRQSNLKSISKEFFITVDNKSYQLQLVGI